MIILAVVAMAVSLNLNGYVKDTNSLIYLASLAVFAAPVSSKQGVQIENCVGTIVSLGWALCR